jgi:hypothetical protein
VDPARLSWQKVSEEAGPVMNRDDERSQESREKGAEHDI